jgi:hypothetical protein
MVITDAVPEGPTPRAIAHEDAISAATDDRAAVLARERWCTDALTRSPPYVAGKSGWAVT